MGTLVISTGLKLNTSNKQRHWICITIPKGRKEHMVSKYWTKANFRFCIFISDIKTFFISPTLFSFFDYSILLSLELALHLFISFPLEVFRDISNILDFIINIGFTYQFLQVSMLGLLGYPLHIPFFFLFVCFPTGFPYLWQGFPETLSCIFDSKYWNTNLKLLSIAAC